MIYSRNIGYIAKKLLSHFNNVYCVSIYIVLYLSCLSCVLTNYVPEVMVKESLLQCIYG